MGHFSPLFIGEVPSTSKFIPFCKVDEAISVPSSSGRSLQLARVAALERAYSHFSPLFIGEVPSTRRP